jgi:hypothetical protein
MAYDQNALTTIASVKGPDALDNVNLAFYATNDDEATVEASDYFGDAVDNGYLGLNDVIFCIYDHDSGTTGRFTFYRIDDVTAGAVTVQKALAYGVTAGGANVEVSA